MGPLYLNTLYLHQERVLSTGAAITNLTPFEFLSQLKATKGSLSWLEVVGEVRGVQLQHGALPLDGIKFYRLNL